MKYIVCYISTPNILGKSGNNIYIYIYIYIYIERERDRETERDRY